VLETAIKNVQEWEKLECTQEEMKMVEILTEKLFELKSKKYTCAITQFVTQDPVQLKCCKNFFENIPLHVWVDLKKTCPTCRKSITRNDIETSV
jgi:hypothetical protein